LASQLLRQVEWAKNVFTGLKPSADEAARLPTQRQPARGRPPLYAGITKTGARGKRALDPSQTPGEEMLTETTPTICQSTSNQDLAKGDCSKPEVG
jgi:hypothetical protein